MENVHTVCKTAALCKSLTVSGCDYGQRVLPQKHWEPAGKEEGSARAALRAALPCTPAQL